MKCVISHFVERVLCIIRIQEVRGVLITDCTGPGRPLLDCRVQLIRASSKDWLLLRQWDVCSMQS